MDRPPVTLIIPTHRPQRALLERVLEAALPQLGAGDEAIVVENNSDTLHDLLQVRVVSEGRPGSAFARARGVAEARGEIIWFLDDDTVPVAGHLAAGLDRLQASARLGIVGGQVDVRTSEGERPASAFVRELFGERPLGRHYLESEPHFRTMPYFIPFTGGSLYRSVVLKAQLAALDTSFSGRTGADGVAGCEDIELAAQALRGGWTVAYEPAMRVEHVIHPRRFATGYLARLSYGSAHSYGRFLVKHDLEPPISIGGAVLRVARRIMLRPPVSREAMFAFLQYAGRTLGRRRRVLPSE